MGRTVTVTAAFFPHLSHYLGVTLVSENKTNNDSSKHVCTRLGGVPILAHFILTTALLATIIIHILLRRKQNQRSQIVSGYMSMLMSLHLFTTHIAPPSSN